MDDFEKELKLGFLDEATQAIADVEQCFLSLELDPQNADNLNKIFRLAHNLKGSSKAVGFVEFGNFTHEFETFILKIKNGHLAVTPAVMNLLLRCNDFVSSMIQGLKEDLSATFNFQALLDEMKAPNVTSEDLKLTDSSSTASSEKSSEVQQEVNSDNMQVPDFENFHSGADELTTESPQLAQPETIPAEVIDFKPLKVETPKQAESPAKSSSSSANSATEESLRVSLAKVEALINFVGEMVILHSVIREQALATGSSLLIKSIHQLHKVGKEIQDTSMGLRMTPIKPIFQKMTRIVRDTALALDKDVQLELEGEETEVDKTVLEKINDPLVHLVRNAVDHGIESKERRASGGKPAKGKVLLRAYHQSGRLIVEVKDDGGGLNPELLTKKAISKGLIKPGLELTPKDAYQLIFAPGFSTKEQVTDVSGRGVGMDVVKTNIKEVGGDVLIDSNLGQGTTFRIVLPLTLAILDAMIVSYSDHKFVLPLNHVYETVPTKDHTVQSSTAIGDVLLLRGENLKLFRLGDFFGLKSRKPLQELITIVIRTGPEPFAIAVDDILGQHQVVSKQLGPELQGIKGLSGSTILGDGKPALILETHDLLKRKLTPGFSPANSTRGAQSA